MDTTFIGVLVGGGILMLGCCIGFYRQRRPSASTEQTRLVIRTTARPHWKLKQLVVTRNNEERGVKPHPSSQGTYP